MNQSYAAIESRINNAINAYSTRNNEKLTQIAREFNVPYHRLRNRLGGILSVSQVRGLYNRLLTPDQDLALVIYCERLVNVGTPARLSSIKTEALKVRGSLPQPRETTSEPTLFVPPIQTPRTIRQLSTTGVELATHSDLPEDL